jgi:hypothetical protein
MDRFMRDDGLEFIFRRLVVPQLGTFQFSKAGDRRVLGSMNELIRSAQFLLIERQLSPFETALLINETPLSYLQDNHPRNCFTAMTPDPGNAGLIQYLKQQEENRKSNGMNDSKITQWQNGRLSRR